MSEPGQNYAAFNSSALLDFVGDVTDESLKATRLTVSYTHLTLPTTFGV